MDRINRLPADTLSDILTRLPAESVQDKCKLVSQTWRNLIEDASFSKMHTNRLMNHSTDSGKLGFLALAKNQELYYIEYTENQETPIDRIRRIKITSLFKFSDFVGSFNGLICLRGRVERFCICNPMTKEYVILPEPKTKFGVFKDRWFGFGYLPSTNEYKIVLMYKVAEFVEVMVYTLGSGHGWRNIGKSELGYDYVSSGHGTFANGALHWMHGPKILVFDLADEKFCEHLSPPPSPTLSIHCSVRSSLLVLGGFLCCSHNVYFRSDIDPSCSDMWLYKKKNDNDGMKEQGTHQSFGWCKEFASPYSTPLARMKSGGILGYGSSFFDTYNPKPKMSLVSKVPLDLKEIVCQVFPHTNTLVSLKEIGEESTKMVQSVKINKKRKRKSKANQVQRRSPKDLQEDYRQEEYIHEGNPKKKTKALRRIKK